MSYFYKILILLIWVINLSICRPIGFASLSKLINNDRHVDTQNQVNDVSPINIQITSTQPTIQQRKSIFEEHPWLDNALTLLFDKLFRLIVILLKKFVFKMDVSMSDFL